MGAGVHPLGSALDRLNATLRGCRFGGEVAFVYNPLDYAGDLFRSYLRRFGTGHRRVLFLGMNPGPWGMAQTGVPFGEVAAVRGWMGLEGRVGRPDPEHPKRPVLGLESPRSEVSGRRLWGLFAERFGPPEAFFRDHIVLNFCPLAFLGETGRNLTPDKLPANEWGPVDEACARFLGQALDYYEPEFLVGVGAFAEARLALVAASAGRTATVGRILHPSPASPAANRDWAGAATRQLTGLGVW